MKNKFKKLSGVFVLLFCIFPAVSSNAHEVWIEAGEVSRPDGLPVQIDVMWGHFPDSPDPINSEDYTLFVRTPAGGIYELAAKEQGGIIRARLSPGEPGQYVFWANRRPSVYFPRDGGAGVLSIQTAKTVYTHKKGNSAVKPAGQPVEITPRQDIELKNGRLNLRVLLEGKPAPGAAVNIYGPRGLEAETASDMNGLFSVDLTNKGNWLIKANIREKAAGEHEGHEYGIKSHTATFFVQFQGREDMGRRHDHRHLPPASLEAAAAVISGLLLIGAGVMTALGRKRRGAGGK